MQSESSCGLRREASRWLRLLERRRLGMPDAVAVELSSEPDSYSGASGDFATVNLLELTGDSSDRLEPLEEIPVELMGFDDGGRLSLPPQVLEVSQAPARAILSLRRTHRAFRWEESKLKEGGLESGSESNHAQGSSTLLPCRACWVGSARSLSGPAACARARALLGGGAAPRATRLRMHDQVPATPVRLQTAPPDPPNEAATLGSALLRIASALEQKHDSGGTVHDAF